MKNLYLTLILFSIWQFGFAQKEALAFERQQLKNEALYVKELKETFTTQDFSSLFTKTDNSSVYGFIGDNYQRIRIKFLSVTKDSTQANTYNVYGKSMVKNIIEEFHGTIKISHIRKYKVTSMGVDDELKGKGLKGQFMILGDYNFTEDQNNNRSGTFKGVFESDFYLDKSNRYHYDDIENYADGYSNNEFVGQWKSYDAKLVKRCNWGDYRIPNSENFDIGAGEFSPADKYLKNGWQSVRDLNFSAPNHKKAKAIEEAKWWL